MRARLLTTVTALCFALPACDETTEVASEARADVDPPQASAIATLGADADEIELPPLAASGRVENADSPITPWCDAVLIAPDVAVTSTHCIEGRYAELFTVSFGDPARPRTANVVEILDDLDPDRRFTALVLATPIADVEPASLHADVPRRCGFDAISHVHADKRVKGNVPSRWIWSGCLDGDILEARHGKPNCHGDQGSGVFADGALIGMTFGPGHFEPDMLCSNEVRVVTVRKAERFFDAALAASRL